MAIPISKLAQQWNSTIMRHIRKFSTGRQRPIKNGLYLGCVRIPICRSTLLICSIAILDNPRFVHSICSHTTQCSHRCKSSKIVLSSANGIERYLLLFRRQGRMSYESVPTSLTVRWRDDLSIDSCRRCSLWNRRRSVESSSIFAFFETWPVNGTLLRLRAFR